MAGWVVRFCGKLQVDALHYLTLSSGSSDRTNSILAIAVRDQEIQGK
ncbi:hypothetical protein [Calothrix sp. UHCC 0171]|nr:hypothetical protein [Calothrix sp. UHCC 0171]MEA5574305.1 hypothetical protein [Calothrix sp. UHCC 0171]